MYQNSPLWAKYKKIMKMDEQKMKKILNFIHFLFQKEFAVDNDDVKISTGDDEGKFGWIAVNNLKGKSKKFDFLIAFLLFSLLKGTS